MAELVVVQEVAAPVERVWDVLTDWDVHDRWMLFTRAEGGRRRGGDDLGLHRDRPGRLPRHDGDHGLGAAAPRGVRHTGKLVRGSGAFEVEALRPGVSRVVWSEWVDLPFGVARPAGLAAGAPGAPRR